MGKGEKFDIFDLAPPLIRALRLYRHWQLSEAQRNEAMRDALADPETAYVLLSRTGRKTSPQTISKIAKWHAVKAGVGVRKSHGSRDMIGGLTSRVSPLRAGAGSADWDALDLNQSRYREERTARR
ncbi:MAG: hypothetical protein ACM3JL_00695 [Nitrososphaerota archaeon]